MVKTSNVRSEGVSVFRGACNRTTMAQAANVDKKKKKKKKKANMHCIHDLRYQLTKPSGTAEYCIVQNYQDTLTPIYSLPLLHTSQFYYS